MPELSGEERAKALRYLLGLLTNQESKSETITYGACLPLVRLLGDDNVEVRRLSCTTLSPCESANSTADRRV